MFNLFRRNRQPQRVLVLGLDCAPPALVFEELRDELPHLRRLMTQGAWGVLNSSTPCITVPAWSSMTSSRDPGVLGIYGFRNRADYSYEALSTANGTAVKEPRLWDVLTDAGKSSLVMNVPQTHPVRSLQGHMVSGFLTPDTGAQFAYPAIFKSEILKQVPDYAFDVRNFRNVPRAELLTRIREVTDAQYKALAWAMQAKEWAFAMHVNIGVDRIQHAFWRYHDSEHRLHEPDSPFNDAIREYYHLIDDWIGRLCEIAGDDTAVIIASDHGAKRMDGAIAINEWLWREGWLSLKEDPQDVTSFSHTMVDWSQTRAWSTGGYYGRIFLNVQGREPQGVIPADDYERVRDDLAAAIAAIPDDNGQPLATIVYKPEDIYQQVTNIAPDLMVYFGDLHWRAVGSVGYGKHYTLENDTGPDDANHAQEGMFIVQHPHKDAGGELAPRQLMDIAPTVLSLLGVDIPPTMQGKPITWD